MVIEVPLAALAVALTFQPESDVTGCQWLCLITASGPGGAPPVPLQAGQPRLPQIAGSTSRTRPPKSLPLAVGGTRAG
jgi:hypothetical protein